MVRELEEGRRKGHDVPAPSDHAWLAVVDPKHTPSAWLSLDLGKGELGAMALALENPRRTVLLDDALARRTAQAAGLTVRGTLGLLLDAKARGLTERVEPWVDKLASAGMWMTPEVAGGSCTSRAKPGRRSPRHPAGYAGRPTLTINEGGDRVLHAADVLAHMIFGCGSFRARSTRTIPIRPIKSRKCCSVVCPRRSAPN